MTIRFAPARNRPSFMSVLTRGSWSQARLPANDNGVPPAAEREMLVDALRHFAGHGLGAALRARENALAAHHAGDAAGFAQWRSICEMLDRRMAARLPAISGRDALSS